VDADGWSLDDKRQPLLADEKLGTRLATTLSDDEHQKNNLPDIAIRWVARNTTELERPRTSQSFCVPKAQIAANGYDLSINRYKENTSVVVDHASPQELIRDLQLLESEISSGLQKLEELVS
jgi:type I restriction enzyme M protein